MKRTVLQRKNNALVAFTLILTFLALCGLTLLPNWAKLDWTNVFIICTIVFILESGLFFYLGFSIKGLMSKAKSVATICSTLVISYAIILLFAFLFNDNVVAVPFTLCALILSLLIESSRSGYLSNFAVVLLYFVSRVLFAEGNIDSQCLYILFAGTTMTLIASVTTNHHYRRMTYVYIGFGLGLVAVLIQSIVYFIYVEAFDLTALLIQWGYAFASGPISVMLMFLLVPILERVFNVVSDFRLAEISSTSAPLLKQLFQKAPGTFNHSLTVANYCEACAAAIGENTFLARACAYYHDIGKMKNPKYFYENQMGQANPHDSMTPEASVATIKSHVINGLAMAKEAKLPVEIQRAIVEHHGTMPIAYFYLKAKRYTDGELPVDNYCYDGLRPTSKISAILMICDACEAALRANQNKEEADLIVENVIKERELNKQFVNCDITFREIEIIKSTILATYQGVQHERILYTDVRVKK